MVKSTPSFTPRLARGLLAIALTGCSADGKSISQAPPPLTTSFIYSLADNAPRETIPVNYEETAFGFIHPSCVLHLKADDEELGDGSVRHADGTVTTVTPCKQPSYDVQGHPVLPAPVPLYCEPPDAGPDNPECPAPGDDPQPQDPTPSDPGPDEPPAQAPDSGYPDPDEPPGTTPTPANPGAEDPQPDDPAANGPVAGSPAPDDSAAGSFAPADPATNGPVAGFPAPDDSAAGAAAPEDPTANGPVAGFPAPDDSAAGAAAPEDPAANGPVAGFLAPEEPSASGPLGGFFAPNDPSTSGPLAGFLAPNDPIAGGAFAGTSAFEGAGGNSGFAGSPEVSSDGVVAGYPAVEDPETVNRADATDSAAQKFSGYMALAIDASNGPLMYYSATWTVPDHPTAREGQRLSYWPGLEVMGAKNPTVLQPVLRWYAPEGGWVILAEHCCRSGMQAQGDHIRVNPGDTIIGTMVGTNCDANGRCEKWIVMAKDQTTGQFSQLMTSGLGQAFDTAMVTLEGFDFTKCSHHSASGAATFYNFTAIKTQGGTVPRFRFKTYAPSANSPCHERPNPSGDGKSVQLLWDTQ